MITRVGIALGSNLGDRLEYLRDAKSRLFALDFVSSEAPVHFLQAPVYESVAVGCSEDSPSFLNSVIELEWTGDAQELLNATQRIESEMGRKEVLDEINAPRMIDLDILYFGENIYSESNLQIPHPRMRERRFVLGPLNDICPNLTLPNEQESISKLLTHLVSDEPELALVQSIW